MKKIIITAAIALASCSMPAPDSAALEAASSPTYKENLPTGFAIAEAQADGLFVRIKSAERASIGTIEAIASAIADEYDRIDLCLDEAHERGDEYASIIDGRLYDYQNDTIYSLKNIMQ